MRRALRSVSALAIALLLPASPGMSAVEREVVGHSVQDRPIDAIRRGNFDARVQVLVVGCIHGNECAGRAIVRKLRKMNAPDDLDLWLMPTLNPDGSRAGTRHNARGVDLNRNFGRGWRASGERWDTYYPGPHPWSEPETRTARELVERVRPEITIWYHQQMALVAKKRRHLYVQRYYARAVGLPLKRLDPLPGTASRWQNHRWPGHLSFVVELPAGSLSTRAARRHARAVLGAGRLWR